MSGDISQPNKGYSDIWILKLNADGSITWDKTFGGSLYDAISSIQNTSDGGYVAVGTSNSANGNIYDSNKGGADLVVIKLNADGSKDWNKTYGGSDDDLANSVQTTSDNGYIITGYTKSNNFDVEDGNNGDKDIWVLKLNADGSKDWDKTFGGSDDDLANSVQTTSDNGYIITGYTKSSNFDVEDGNNGTFDVWVLKLNADGSKAWDKTFGGTQAEIGWSIQKTFHGGYIILATTTSSGGDGDIKDENNGDYDVWVIKLDSEGNISY